MLRNKRGDQFWYFDSRGMLWNFMIISTGLIEKKTSRERPKSALYLRFKKALQSNGEFGTFYEKTERGTLWDFSTSILLQNSKQIEGTIWWRKKIEKSRTVPKKI